LEFECIIEGMNFTRVTELEFEGSEDELKLNLAVKKFIISESFFKSIMDAKKRKEFLINILHLKKYQIDL
jgi:hypothetical protein